MLKLFNIHVVGVPKLYNICSLLRLNTATHHLIVAYEGQHYLVLLPYQNGYHLSYEIKNHYSFSGLILFCRSHLTLVFVYTPLYIQRLVWLKRTPLTHPDHNLLTCRFIGNQGYIC